MASKNSVYQELERILASDLFGGKRQAGNFLRYIVGETLAGRGERITQYGIAVEALGKPVDYCPTESPAVRVEAGRVRKLLEEYYAGEGIESSCYIYLPVGGYQPEFRKPDISQLQLRRLSEKRVRSSGPKVFLSFQNPALIRDQRQRDMLYSFRSNLPVVMGALGTVQVALADPGHSNIYTGNILEYAWLQHQAEFLLQCELVLQDGEAVMRCVLIHTFSREVVWRGTQALVADDPDTALDALFSVLMTDVFSYDRGVAMLYWGRYWYRQEQIPDYYQVLVAHILFIQEHISEDHFFTFWHACQKRCCQYDDDSLAQLHYGIACLYALMLKVDVGMSLAELWQRQALAGLEMNPGSAVAHAVFALNCYSRGDSELCRVEIETARRQASYDEAFDRLVAVGLCTMGGWGVGYSWLKTLSMFDSAHPDPLRSVSCLQYFRRGEYARFAAHPATFANLGGWGQFGELVGLCKAGNCKDCIQTIGSLVDKVSPPADRPARPHDIVWIAEERERHMASGMGKNL